MKIVLSVVLAMLIVGCNDGKGSQQSNAHKSVEKVTTVTKTKEEVAPKKEAVSEAQTIKVDKVALATNNIAGVNGVKIFRVCSSCHGVHAEKKALGKSQVIQGWNAPKIVAALKGYKNGTYGGTMKAVMQGQAAKLSDADIKAVAKYISNL